MDLYHHDQVPFARWVIGEGLLHEPFVVVDVGVQGGEHLRWGLLGDQVRVRTQILAMDGKRLHLAHEMFMIANGERAATQELLYLHVDLGARRVVPFPNDVQQRVGAAAAAHAHLPRPDWVGRRIAMPS